MNSAINPFFNPRIAPDIAKPTFAELPVAPRNASPVPHLTSLYHFNSRDHYGKRSYPGNCGGGLIRDLILYFQPASVFDPMTGSGTCADVCRELGVNCLSSDIRDGFDAASAGAFASLPRFDFIWVHPPYWRQKLYSTDERDLSRASTLEVFLERYESFIRNCAAVLSAGGKFAILMGDYCDREYGFVPLTYHTKRLALAAGLRPYCTDIIRFSHGASSSRKTYRTSFIPGLHDVCMIFEKSLPDA